VLACDTVRTLAAIDQPHVLHRILRARRFLLWLVVAPVCLLIAFIDGIGAPDRVVVVYSRWPSASSRSASSGCRRGWACSSRTTRSPSGTGGSTGAGGGRCWADGERWCSSPMPWCRPSPSCSWPHTADLGPHLAKGLTSKLPDNDLGLGIALACVIAIGAAYFGQRASLWLVARRRDRLVAYLADPTRG